MHGFRQQLDPGWTQVLAGGRLWVNDKCGLPNATTFIRTFSVSSADAFSMSGTAWICQLDCRLLSVPQGNPWFEKMEHRAGIEPASIGFADRRVNRFATGAHLGSNRGDASAVGGLGRQSVEVSLRRIVVAGEGIRTLPIAVDG